MITPTMKRILTLLFALLLVPLISLRAADATAKAQNPAPEHRKYELPIEPDENVSYGPHRMQVIYFWRAKSEQPTPLLVYIHGGGWQGGDRSVAYRMIKDATADGLVPPVKGPMLDCARALRTGCFIERARAR